jgi:hypothetical protein
MHFYACQTIHNRRGTLEKVRQSMFRRALGEIFQVGDILSICCEFSLDNKNYTVNSG